MLLTRSNLKVLPAWLAALCIAFVFFQSTPLFAATPMLSDDEIAKLQEKSDNPKNGTKFVFTASFHVRKASPDKLAKYRESGAVPYRVVCALNEIKKTDDGALSMRQSGKVEIRVLDKEKKVVGSASMPLEKMCAS